MRRKLIVVGLVAVVVATAYVLGLHRYLTVDALQANQSQFKSLYAAHPNQFMAAFVALQVAALAACIPGAVLVPALAAGALFGTLWGCAVALFALTVGDTLGFLIARNFATEWVHRRYPRQLAAIERGIAADGAFYLLALRLAAMVPYFVVNVTMALTRMPLRVFAPVSFIGLVPATVLHVYAGTALAQITSPRDVVSLPLALAFASLGLLALGGRLWWKRRFAISDTPVPD